MEGIKEAYIAILGEDSFNVIENRIDSEGWLRKEANEDWRVLDPHLINRFDFKEDNNAIRPKSLNQA